MYAEQDKVIDFLLHSLINNGGQANFMILHGKGFKGNDITSAQNFLESQGYIKKVPSQFNLMFTITQPGRNYYLDRLIILVLSYLNEQNKFMWVHDVFKDLSINVDRKLADIVGNKLTQQELVFSTDDSGIMINDTGRNYLYNKLYGFEELKESSIIINSNDNSVTVGNNFSGILTAHSRQDNSDLSFMPIVSSPITSTIAETKQGNKNAVIKWILEHIVLVVAIAVSSGLIVAYLAYKFKWV